MSLPHLLLVDDSEAVLAFERAALAGHYALTNASNGLQALQTLARLRPAAVLLDLSMPQMDGDELLARMQADPRLRDVPVIIVSSERRRAEQCLRAGARAYLPKPVRAEDLLSLVARVLAEVRREQRAANLAVLLVSAGAAELGLPLEAVESVLHQVATLPLAGAPPFASASVDLHGERVAVLDLALRLGQVHSVPLDERKLVVVAPRGERLAICVDRVRDPIEIAAADLRPAEFGADGAPAEGNAASAIRDSLGAEAIIAIALTASGLAPIVDPAKLLSASTRDELRRALAASPAPAEVPR